MNNTTPVYPMAVIIKELGGMDIKTIHRYIKAKIIKAKKINGKYMFSQLDLERALFIRRLIKEVGLNMRGAKLVMDNFNDIFKNSTNYKLYNDELTAKIKELKLWK